MPATTTWTAREEARFHKLYVPGMSLSWLASHFPGKTGAQVRARARKTYFACTDVTPQNCLPSAAKPAPRLLPVHSLEPASSSSDDSEEDDSFIASEDGSDSTESDMSDGARKRVRAMLSLKPAPAEPIVDKRPLPKGSLAGYYFCDECEWPFWHSSFSKDMLKKHPRVCLRHSTTSSFNQSMLTSADDIVQHCRSCRRNRPIDKFRPAHHGVKGALCRRHDNGEESEEDEL
jgi:hypothetical protein